MREPNYGNCTECGRKLEWEEWDVDPLGRCYGCACVSSEQPEIKPRNAEEAAALAMVNRTLDAMQAVKIATTGQKGVSGKITCPACSLPLAYGVARNGHTSGKCETEGCVSWME